MAVPACAVKSAEKLDPGALHIRLFQSLFQGLEGLFSVGRRT